MVNLKLSMISFFALSLVMGASISFPSGYTCEDDVNGVRGLYAALGYPMLPGWTPFGGDPCLQGWQGVQCVGPNITAIIINDANLGGELGDELGNFTSIITFDLSNNRIGGSIPKNLPLTLRQFFLSSNRLSGKIPSSLAELTLLSDMSLNENFLSGELPDAFQFLSGLVNLDVSSNNLSGGLPPSISSLSSLTTFHVQDNHLSGTLEVLQDLPLMNLNIENNLFSGPVPVKLWNIPNFRSNGNPFNTTIAPSSSPIQAMSSLFAPAPSPTSDPSTLHGGTTSSTRREKSTMRVTVYAGVVVTIVIAVFLVVCAWKFREKMLNFICSSKSKKVMAPKMSKLPLSSTHMSASNYRKEKCFGNASTVGQQMEQETHLIKSFTGLRPIIAEKALAKPIVSSIKEINHNLSLKEMSSKKISAPFDSVTSFSVALLQQCTNYFGDDYLIRNTNMGKVYMAELYEGKLFTVLKLNKLSSSITVDDFHQLVTHLSELRHQNIIELVGYCSEFGERLLTFKYFSKITLHDLLYGSLKKRLSWNDRIQIALETAKAMEYLHEFCKPPVMLRNLEPSCILLDDELSVRISEYGLSMFVLSNSLTQFSCARAPLGYDVPENGEPGPYTVQSDVYSFGVVMLELLTGRQRYDRSQSLEEHHLVRWASSQLYDMNALSKIVDPYIDGVVSLKPLSRFADIISRCIQQAPEFRPSMSQIVQDISLVLNDAPV